MACRSATVSGARKRRRSKVAKTSTQKQRRKSTPIAELRAKLKRRTEELDEALERQTATSEVLEVISSSAGDLQPVFRSMLNNALRICEAKFGQLLLFDGKGFLAAELHDTPAEYTELFKYGPLVPGPDTGLGRLMASKKVIHIPDVMSGELYAEREPLRIATVEILQARTLLAVPMLKDTELVGAIIIYRQEARPFSQRQIELVTNFAAQAVIAIENTRLLNDTKEALAHQTGSSNVLRVIASSPTDVEPVLEAIVESARELCEANDAIVLLRDGEHLRFSAHSGPLPITVDKWPIGRGWTAGRAFVDQRPVHVHDMLSEEGSEFPDARVMGQWTGATIHTVLSTPLLHGTESIGAILLRRAEVRPFSDKQINLLATFADQAVIAIQNTRLFNETKEALEQQKTSADILSVISHSVAETQPVFDEILRSIARLFGSQENYIFLVGDDNLLHVGAGTGQRVEQARALFPAPMEGTVSQVAIRERRLISSASVFDDPELPAPARERYRSLGENYSMMVAPMLWEDRAIGSIMVARASMQPFSEKECNLLRTFADQAVIAIQNARLFDQVQARTRELSKSLDDLRAAQDRLVQTEKLASLGQLTAGIAHEIKNPLNFVNNFSALSVELTDELNEALKQATMAEKTRVEVDELTGLLKNNLAKVVQHGKRADSIVKNMLQHSREGSGEHRFADINAIVEDSLNLAYHGARAEKSGFAITLRHDLDPQAGAAELYPQEITRALLNLISNGFYAATRRRLESADDSFEPVLSAATRNLGTAVEIRIRDNGTGIPPDVREKMFVPFFTTKPTGEGTGLGLSMTHDIIVKQHGGRIEVETEPGAFTEFIITLPRHNGSAD